LLELLCLVYPLGHLLKPLLPEAEEAELVGAVEVLAAMEVADLLIHHP
jgi:hypothetical protein